MIYLDNNATTRVADEVLEAMTPLYREAYGNPHSSHALGRAAHDAIERARDEVRSLLSARDGRLVFTSCGTESNALVIRGLLHGERRRRVVATSVEHPSILGLLRALERDGEIELAIVPVFSTGAIDMEAIARAIDDDTLLVAVMLAQNETGVIHDVAAIARLAEARGVKVLVDAVQAAGKIPVDVHALGATFLSISGHKYHAPKGIGALWIHDGVDIEPLWRGGGQEYGLRSGTESVPLIAGLGRASRLALERLPAQDLVRRQRDRFERGILGGIPGASVNGSEPRLPNTSNISFRGALSGDIVGSLDQRGLCASAGAACHSGSAEPSAVMVAMGKARDEGLGAVRFSLSRYTTDAEIDAAIDMVVAAVAERLPAQAW